MNLNFPAVFSPVVFSRAAVIALCAGATPLWAQVQSVAPAFAVVSVDSAPLRCGPGERFYSVAPLSAGTILIIDGEGAGWSRVTYPAGQGAFLRAEDATIDPAKTGTLTLAKESRLRAASQVHGYSGSWQVLLDVPMTTGSALTIIETAKEGEAVVAYKVQAPVSARGYVASASLRKASQAEVDAYKASGKVLPVIDGALPIVEGTSVVIATPVPETIVVTPVTDTGNQVVSADVTTKSNPFPA